MRAEVSYEESAIHAAEAILSAVVFGARDFMNRPDWDAVLDEFLERLGRATASSQVRLFENDPPVPGQPLSASMTAQWIAPGVTAGSALSELQGISYSGVGCGRWETELASGRMLLGLTAEFPPSERPILESQGVVSVVIVPIFVGDRWYGFLGLSDCEEARPWSEAEVNALSAAASILGAAHARRELETRIDAAATQERLAADIATALSARGETIDQILERCCQAVVTHLHAGFVRIWSADETSRELSARASAGRLGGIGADAPVGEHALAGIARSLEPAVWRAHIPDLWPGSADAFRAAGLTGGVGWPLVISGRLVGVMVTLLDADPSVACVDAVGAISSEIALAIEHSRARYALHRSEDRYQRLVEATVEGICIHDGVRLLDCNPSLAHMVGWEVKDVFGRNPFDFMHPSCHADVRARIVANYQGPYEALMVRRDGSVFPSEMKGKDFFVDGQKLRMTAIRDITERKDAERAAIRLAEERAAREAAEGTRLRAEFLGDASTLLASSFDTTTTLNQLARLSVPFLADSCVVALMEDGRPQPVAIVRADPIATTIALAPDDVGWVPGPDGDAATSGAILEGGRVMSAPIRSGGELIGAITFARRDDGRPYRPEDLALAQELGARAATAIQTARSYHDAQAATRARDEMLAVVAHDLRNPLNTIYMGSSLALDLTADEPPSPARTQLEVIVRSANHMNRLIQDLLDATRVQSGQLALEKAATDPHAIVDEAMELLAPLAANAGIELVSDVDSVTEPVLVDRMRIIQVLSNLIGNALKFTPRGGRVVLEFGTVAGTPSFRVSDDGAGIPADQLPHIFGRFWQARRTDQRGLGLGLAIARGVVEAHGGRIWVESTPGVGSSFQFTVAPDHPSAAPDHPSADL